MPYRSAFTFLAVVTTLMTGAAAAGAEVPQSRITPPHEGRISPLQLSAQGTAAADEAALKAVLRAWRKTEDYRESRRSRTMGIVLLAVSGATVPVGAASLVSMAGRSSGSTDGAGGMFDLVGAGLLAVGGVSLMVGIPLFVRGVTAKPPMTMPAVQIGSRSASLTWTF